MTGFVSFVGSGPGDPELLTVKAIQRLKAAEVILFDDLSSGPILDHAGSQAELIGVGKRAGRASPKQDHVSQLLVDYASQGAHVVRLKSGDPGIFGRLEEELVALQAANIDFEIIPGVTAASAAAAAAQIPLTRRHSARRVQFITGHDVAGALPEDINLAAIADPHCTTVVYMPKRTFPKLAALLIANDISPQTPALLAESVSTETENLYRSTLAELAEHLKQDPGPAPGLILIGPLAVAEGNYVGDSPEVS